MRYLLALLLAMGSLSAAGRADAAESYDNCTGYIESIPVSITTQGTWCLKHDVSTSITLGTALSINANNVTLDCNGFKIGGLGAGISTATFGISSDKLNATVRNCNVRGFYEGIFLQGDNAVIEHNRADANTHVGIRSSGDGNLIRGNVVTDTGGYTGDAYAYGIIAAGIGPRVIDNSIDRIFIPGHGQQSPTGIAISNGLAQGNQISNLVTSSEFPSAVGISMAGMSIASDNRLLPNATSPVNGIGIKGAGTASSDCFHNVVLSYTGGIYACALSGNLVTGP